MKNMKKMILFISMISAFALQGVFAQYSQLTVFHQNGERFWVIINGVKQNAQPQANVFISELKDDFVRVKIIFEDEKVKDIDRNIQLKDVDGNFTHSKYIIKPEKKKTAMRFHSYEVIVPPAAQVEVPVTKTVETPVTKPVEAPVETKPTTTTTTTTTHTTTVKPTETISVGAYVTDPETGKPIGMDVSITVPVTEEGEVGFQTTTKTPDGQFSTQTQTTTTQTTVTHQQHTTKPQITEDPVKTPAEKPNVYQMPGYNGKIGCPWPMAAQDFASAKGSVSSKSFEDSKLTVAKQIASANCLLCDQVKEIMGLFSFEDTKLEFAKFAYDYVYDLNNYYKLNDVFTFSSSIEELDEYVRTKK
jgi:hypothetical protein